MAEGPGGIFVKGDDGSLYFVRDELLSACKVEGDDLEKWGPVVDGQTPDVEGFSLNFEVSPVAHKPFVVSGSQLNPAPADLARVDLGRAASTIMCPW